MLLPCEAFTAATLVAAAGVLFLEGLRCKTASDDTSNELVLRLPHRAALTAATVAAAPGVSFLNTFRRRTGSDDMRNASVLLLRLQLRAAFTASTIAAAAGVPLRSGGRGASNERLSSDSVVRKLLFMTLGSSEVDLLFAFGLCQRKRQK